jgi:hypothetical protein
MWERAKQKKSDERSLAVNSKLLFPLISKFSSLNKKPVGYWIGENDD